MKHFRQLTFERGREEKWGIEGEKDRGREKVVKIKTEMRNLPVER